MSKIKLGIIGAGKITDKHLTVIKSIKEIKVEVLCSRSIIKCSSLAKKYNIKNISSNKLDLINKYNLDGILILVSSENIFSITNFFLKYKIPLFIEKPPGLNFEETKELVRINKKFKTPTLVGLNRRFFSIFHKGMDLIHKKGKLLAVNIEGHERMWLIKNKLKNKVKKNWIYGNSIHTIDLLSLFGGKIQTISSLNSKDQKSIKSNFGALIKFKNGAIGSYTSFWNSPGSWSVTLFGEQISVVFKPLEKGIVIDNKLKEKPIKLSSYDTKYKPGFYLQMCNFINLIKTHENTWPGNSLEDSYESVKIAKKLFGN